MNIFNAAIKNPVKTSGGWFFRLPPKHIWRYNRRDRRKLIEEWTRYGGLAVAQAIGGGVSAFGAMIVDGPVLAPTDFLMLNGALGLTNFTYTLNTQYCAFVFRAPKTGNLDSFAMFTGTVVGVSTADFQFETIDLATGLPSGTLFAANTSKIGVSVVSDTWTDPGSFTAAAAVTQGDLLAAVFRFNTGTSIQVVAMTTALTGNQFPYLCSSGAKSGSRYCPFSIKYTDGTYPSMPNSFPVSSTTLSEAFNSGSNPNHRGGVYTPTVGKVVVGQLLTCNYNADFTSIVALDSWDGTADNDGTSNLTTALDKDVLSASTQSGIPGFIIYSKSLTVPASTKVRTLIKPGGTNITFPVITVNAAAILGHFDLGQTFCYTAANNPVGAGSWTDTATKRPINLGFRFSSYNVGAGAHSF